MSEGVRLERGVWLGKQLKSDGVVVLGRKIELSRGVGLGIGGGVHAG